MNLILEVTDKKGVDVQRVNFSDSQLVFGRGWDCDVILQDKYVDSHHLRLSLNDDGRVIISETGSLNGTRINKTQIKGDVNIYDYGSPIYLGDTTLRLFDASSEVKKTVPRSPWFSLPDYFKTIFSLFVLGVLASGLLLVKIKFFELEKIELGQISYDFMIYFIVLLLFSLILSSAGKLIKGQANFKAHWVLVCLLILFQVVFALIISVVRFNLQNRSFGETLDFFLLISFMFLLFFAVLTYITSLERRAKWAWSILMVCVFMLSHKSDSLFKDEHELWSDRSYHEYKSLPTVFLLRSTGSIEDHFKDNEALFDQLE